MFFFTQSLNDVILSHISCTTLFSKPMFDKNKQDFFMTEDNINLK